MAGFMSSSQQYLNRANLWSRELKELLLDDLMGLKFVRVIKEFPDGQVINIPSIGEAEVLDYNEGQAIKYGTLDTGNFQFSFDQYIYSAHAMSEKFKRDSYYASDVIAAFVPRERRAIMERVETRILAVANSGQTASSLNVINGATHRRVASGTSQKLTLADIANAYYALQKANVPMRNLVAIVDPSVAYTIQTDSNVTNYLSPMPMWSEVVKSGLVTGTQFRFSLYGFDFYISNYLPQGISETINSVAVTNGVANYFFSAAPGDTLPWIGGFRQLPTVYSEFNKDLQQEEYLTIAEFGFKLFREENLVTILTSTAAVPA